MIEEKFYHLGINDVKDTGCIIMEDLKTGKNVVLFKDLNLNKDQLVAVAIELNNSAAYGYDRAIANVLALTDELRKEKNSVG